MAESKANPPFATKDGKPISPTSDTASGGHDFLTDNTGSGPATGGRDFIKESRPQTEAKPEVMPNGQSIPAGGKILLADPQPVSRKVSGTAEPINNPKPFKL